MNKKQYTLIIDNRADNFSKNVTDHLMHGWELYGSPTISASNALIIYAQAMTREFNE